MFFRNMDIELIGGANVIIIIVSIIITNIIMGAIHILIIFMELLPLTITHALYFPSKTI